jgi:LacI family transcriptional regulator
MAEVITAAGLRIPADISLTGFDDMPLAATLRGGLTTARQPFQEAGRVAVRHLLRLIEGEEPARCRETLAAPLVTRATTAPVPTQIIIPTPDAKEPETS